MTYAPFGTNPRSRDQLGNSEMVDALRSLSTGDIGSSILRLPSDTTDPLAAAVPEPLESIALPTALTRRRPAARVVATQARSERAWLGLNLAVAPTDAHDREAIEAVNIDISMSSGIIRPRLGLCKLKHYFPTTNGSTRADFARARSFVDLGLIPPDGSGTSYSCVGGKATMAFGVDSSVSANVILPWSQDIEFPPEVEPQWAPDVTLSGSGTATISIPAITWQSGILRVIARGFDDQYVVDIDGHPSIWVDSDRGAPLSGVDSTNYEEIEWNGESALSWATGIGNAPFDSWIAVWVVTTLGLSKPKVLFFEP